jgi:hypothetical protein
MNKLKIKLQNILGDSYLYFLIYKIAYFIKVFFFIRPSINKSLDSSLIPLKNLNISEPTVVVPLLEISHYMNFHVLGLAKSFSVRGYKVIVIVCDEFLPACEIKSCRTSMNENFCFKCSINRSILLKSYNLEVKTLSEIFSSIDDPITYGKKVLSEYKIDKDLFQLNIEDSVTRHFYGSEVSYHKDEVLKIRKQHEKTAYISLALGDILYKDYSPKISLNVMVVYSAWGPINQLFESVGIAPITVSMTQFDFHSVRLNNPDLFRHHRSYDRFLKNRSNAPINNAEEKILNNFLSKRKSGKDSLMKEWRYFNTLSFDDLKIDNNKKNIFMFTNVPWDQGLNEFAGIFLDVFDWVYKTVEFAKNNKNINLWIKPHPAEVRGTAKSGKSVAEFIRIRYPQLPDNIHIIDAEKGISPYDLFDKIDLGIVLTGTLGLEMALDGIPVISAGINPCYGLGLLSEPKTQDEYFKLFDTLKDRHDNAQKIKDLKLFCYFYFIHQSFKWPLTKQSFGDNFYGYNFDSLSELKPGNNKDLDIIFNEIDILVEDFKNNY